MADEVKNWSFASIRVKFVPNINGDPSAGLGVGNSVGATVGVMAGGVELGAGGTGVLVGGTVVLVGVADLTAVGALVGVAVGVPVEADGDRLAVGLTWGVRVLPYPCPPRFQATAESCGEPASEGEEEIEGEYWPRPPASGVWPSGWVVKPPVGEKNARPKTLLAARTDAVRGSGFRHSSRKRAKAVGIVDSPGTKA